MLADLITKRIYLRFSLYGHENFFTRNLILRVAQDERQTIKSYCFPIINSKLEAVKIGENEK